ATFLTMSEDGVCLARAGGASFALSREAAATRIPRPRPRTRAKSLDFWASPDSETTQK
ncbi:unnamed protein product, partial [Symbiodinium sp. KB8]